MLTYIFIFFCLSLACFVSRDWRQEKIYVVVVLLFLILFVGTRFNVGCDFDAYYLRFQSFQESESFWEVLQRDEPGYWIMAYITKQLGLNYVWLNVFGAVFFYSCVGVFALRSPNAALFLAIMFPIMVVQLSMSGLRQAMAVAFFMLALMAFMDGKRWSVMVFILMGSIFHQSLVLFLPLVLAIGKEFSTSRVLIAFLLLAPIAILISGDRLDVYSDRYVEQIYGEMESTGAIFRQGLLVLSAIVFEIYREKMKLLFPKHFNLMRIFSLMTFAIIPIMVVSTVVVHRLGYYILPVQLLTLSLLPYAIFPNLRSINFGQIFPIGVYAAYILVWFSFASHAEECYIPYKSFLGNLI